MALFNLLKLLNLHHYFDTSASFNSDNLFSLSSEGPNANAKHLVLALRAGTVTGSPLK